MRSIVILAALSLLAPAGARAHEEEGQWESPPPAPAEDPGVDVSVGLSAPGAAVTFDTFQEPLAAQGDWVSVNTYGRVWRPRVADGWRPYHYGRWEWTSEGWLWVSDEPFGWATYHYGRWTQDPSYGWVWIPGYQWAPAWVTWRYSPEYVGWAPLGPGFSVYVTSYPAVYPWWTFVPCGYFVGHPIHRYAYAPSYIPRIWRDTRPAPPRAVAFGHAAPAWGGPARGFVETRIGRPLSPVRVQPVASPGALREARRDGVVPVYRPEHRPARPAGGGAAPSVPGRAGEPRGYDRRELPRAAPPGQRQGWAPGADRRELPRAAPPGQRQGWAPGADRRELPRAAPPGQRQGWAPGGDERRLAPPAPPRQRDGGRPQAVPQQQHYPGGSFPAPRYQGGSASAPRYQGGGAMAPPSRAPAPTPQHAPPARREQGGRGERPDHGNRGDRH